MAAAGLDGTRHRAGRMQVRSAVSTWSRTAGVADSETAAAALLALSSSSPGPGSAQAAAQAAGVLAAIRWLRSRRTTRVKRRTSPLRRHVRWDSMSSTSPGMHGCFAACAAASSGLGVASMADGASPGVVATRTGAGASSGVRCCVRASIRRRSASAAIGSPSGSIPARWRRWMSPLAASHAPMSSRPATRPYFWLSGTTGATGCCVGSGAGADCRLLRSSTTGGSSLAARLTTPMRFTAAAASALCVAVCSAPAASAGARWAYTASRVTTPDVMSTAAALYRPKGVGPLGPSAPAGSSAPHRACHWNLKPSSWAALAASNRATRCRRAALSGCSARESRTRSNTRLGSKSKQPIKLCSVRATEWTLSPVIALADPLFSTVSTLA